MSINEETLGLADGMRGQVAAHVDGVTQDIDLAWARAWNEVAAEWEAAIADLIAASKDGAWPPAGKVRRARRALRARDATRELLLDLQGMVPVRILADVDVLVEDVTDWQRRLTASQYPPQAGGTVLVASTFERVDKDAIKAIVDRTSGNVVARTQPLSAQADAAMRSVLVKGVAVGDGPEAAAREMLARVGGAFDGGKRRALTIARTELLDAHRAAGRAQQDRLHAQGVVTGWTWMANLDRRTCFPAGTLITTDRGDRPIEAIVDGDAILTHTGQWRRAYAPMARRHSGAMVTIEAGGMSVTCTSDHPVLIERQSELQWMEARGVRHGDSVLSHRESVSDGGHHVFGQRPVEGRSVEAQDRDAAALHEGILAGVPAATAVMPVGLVNLDAEASTRKEEVDRAFPARDSVLLDELATEGFKREAHAGLGLGLPGVAPVAARRAEAPPVAGDGTELLAALPARDDHRRASTLLRAALQLATLRVEDATAALTRREGRVGVGTLDGAVAVPRGVTPGHREGVAAAHARLGHLSQLVRALAGAVLGRAAAAGHEGLSAVGARPLDFGLGVAPLAVGAPPLVGVVAASAAEPTRRLPPGPRRRDLELGTAPLTSEFHRHIVSSVATHYQTLTVHNFEVEEDHSYIANGIAVHNCPSCIAMHGTEHPASVPGPLDHQQGRCDRLPSTASWSDLGFPDIEEPPSILPDSRAWFDDLPQNDRVQIMGQKRLDLLDSGDITWADLSSRRETTGWRPSYVPTPVADLAG